MEQVTGSLILEIKVFKLCFFKKRINEPWLSSSCKWMKSIGSLNLRYWVRALFRFLRAIFTSCDHHWTNRRVGEAFDCGIDFSAAWIRNFAKDQMS